MINPLKTSGFFIMIIILISLNACKSESKNDFKEFINEMNLKFGHNLNCDDFFAEKKENIIYHTMIDNNTMFSLYSNKNGEIIQCTLSSFDIKNTNNLNFLTESGLILTGESKESLNVMFKNAETNGTCSEKGWTISIVKNDLAVTYIINRTTSEINDNQKPTVKNF